MAETTSVHASQGEGEHTIDRRAGQSSNGAAEPDELPDEIQRIVDGRDPTDELSLDDIFELLKNARRREVIQYLGRQEDETATLSDLAEHIAALENEIEVTQLSSDQRKRVYIGLYQCHLPKMDDMGVIDFDSNRGTIELKETVTQLQPYLERTDEPATAPMPLFELSVTLGVLFVIATAVAGIGPVAALPPISLAVISTVALVTVAARQLARYR